MRSPLWDGNPKLTLESRTATLTLIRAAPKRGVAPNSSQVADARAFPLEFPLGPGVNTPADLSPMSAVSPPELPAGTHHGLETLVEPLRGVCLTIGNFDGVHVGHQRLLRSVVDVARGRGGSAVLLTFWPHPLALLRGEAPDLLCDIGERCRLALSHGLDRVVIARFSRAFSETEPRAFVEEVLLRHFELSHVAVGFNFGFGRRAAGNAELLARFGQEYGFPVEVVPPVMLDHEPVSSSRVRRAVREGRVADARRMLARPHSLVGIVVHGYGRGRTVLGIPTANVDVRGGMVPATGIYAAWVYGDGLDRPHPAAVSIGRNPTFGTNPISVEAHLIDFDADLYGRRLTVALVDRVRDEARFESVDALRAKISEDIEWVRRALAREGIPEKRDWPRWASPLPPH